MLEVGLHDGWAGLYEVTPDHNALIGRSTSTPNFLYATGFSGHGFLQAPAVSEVVRDLCLNRTPAIDTSPLSTDRFTTHTMPRPESHIVLTNHQQPRLAAADGSAHGVDHRRTGSVVAGVAAVDRAHDQRGVHDDPG